MSSSRSQKRKPEQSLTASEKKPWEKKEKEKKPSLNGLQKNMIDSVLDIYITSDTDDCLSELKPTEALRLLDLMLESDDKSTITADEIFFFKKNNLLDNIIYMRKLLQHPFPQNRMVGDPNAFIKGHLKGREPETKEEKIAAGEIDQVGVSPGVFRGEVYFFTSKGAPGPVVKEPQGMLSLTSIIEIKPDESTVKHGFFTSPSPEAISREAVVDYIQERILAAKIIQRKKIKVGEEKVGVIKVDYLNEGMRLELALFLQKKAMSLESIDREGLWSVAVSLNKGAKIKADPLFKLLTENGISDIANDIYLKGWEVVSKTLSLIRELSDKKIIKLERLQSNDKWKYFLFASQLIKSNIISLSMINAEELGAIFAIYHFNANDYIKKIKRVGWINTRQFVGPTVQKLHEFGLTFENFLDNPTYYITIAKDHWIMFLLEKKLASVEELNDWEFLDLQGIATVIHRSEIIQNLIWGKHLTIAKIDEWSIDETLAIVSIAKQPLIQKLIINNRLTLENIKEMSEEQREQFLVCIEQPFIYESLMHNTSTFENILAQLPTLTTSSLKPSGGGKG